MLLHLTIHISQPEQIDVPEDALTIAQGVITTPAQHAALMNLIHNEEMMSVLAAYHFFDKYETTESIDHLNKAIEFLEKAVEYIPRNNLAFDVRCSRWTMLGDAYGRRYQRTGSTHDLERSIELITDAINFMTDSPHIFDYLDFLAESYSCLGTYTIERFMRFGSSEDIRTAVDAAEMAVNLTPPDSPDWPARMSCLGLCLGERSMDDVIKEDLDWAIECFEMAVDARASLNPNDPGPELNNLAVLLETRFTSRGTVEDLYRSVELLENAVKVSSTNRSMRCYFLHSLAIVLVMLYEHHGTDQDLDRAIELQRTAVDQTPEGHTDGASRAAHLGLWLVKRAEKTVSTEDITYAVDAIQAAIKAIPKDHAARPRLLMDLGASLHQLSRRTSWVVGLEDAIEATREAISSFPQGHHGHTACLNNLSIMLGHRAWYTARSPGTRGCPEAQSSDPLSEAIAISKASVDATEEGHADRPKRLSNLGSLFESRFVQNGHKNPDDINACIKFARQAVDTSPRESHQRAMYLERLGTSLIIRYSMIGMTEGNTEDQTDALDCFKEGWTLQKTAAPSLRIQMAQQAAGILASRSNWKEAGHFLEEAIKLMPSITPRSLQHADKQDMLAKFVNLACTAAAVALNAGNSAYDALKLLELGRGVIAGLFLDMRGDISDLKAQHPSLAAEFLSVRDELDSPPDIRDSTNSARDVSVWEMRNRKRRETERKFSQLVEEIQSLKGFRHFCGTPDEVELKAAAGSGPIVVINVSVHRCDAFLIERDSIRVLELPDLTMEKVEERLTSLRQSVAGHHADMTELLEWLWTSVTRPCLDALKFTSPISSENTARWPRIWWIPTGPLSQFPLHAAGRHRHGGGEAVIDRVMSSYALSLKTVIHGRRYCLPTGTVGSSSNRALLLAMSTTPGLEGDGRLLWAQQEVDMVAELCPELHLQKSTPEPLKDVVLDDLKSCKIFHFAGHGQSNAAQPSRSCLLLQDWKNSPLTVTDFRDCRLQDQEVQPFLGYLSACSTGANEAQKLADEGIHLISSLQLAGFRHVVGTLWEVSDQHCVDVTRVFYETLRDKGMTDEAVCQGLHRATRALRDRSFNGKLGQRKAFCVDDGITRRDFMDYHWVPYVHFGI